MRAQSRTPRAYQAPPKPHSWQLLRVSLPEWLYHQATPKYKSAFTSAQGAYRGMWLSAFGWEAEGTLKPGLD